MTSTEGYLPHIPNRYTAGHKPQRLLQEWQMVLLQDLLIQYFMDLAVCTLEVMVSLV